MIFYTRKMFISQFTLSLLSVNVLFCTLYHYAFSSDMATTNIRHLEKGWYDWDTTVKYLNNMIFVKILCTRGMLGGRSNYIQRNSEGRFTITIKAIQACKLVLCISSFAHCIGQNTMNVVLGVRFLCI